MQVMGSPASRSMKNNSCKDEEFYCRILADPERLTQVPAPVPVSFEQISWIPPGVIDALPVLTPARREYISAYKKNFAD